MAGASFFFLASATMASVLIITPATEAPARPSPVNNAGAQHVDILLGLRVEAIGLGLVLVNLANHHQPSTPAFSTIWWTGSSSAHNVDIGLDVGIIVLELANPALARSSATPPPATMRFTDVRTSAASFRRDARPDILSIVEVNVE